MTNLPTEVTASVLTEADMNLLVGHAEFLRLVHKQTEIPAALLDLAERLALARGDAKGAAVCRKLALRKG